MGVVARGMVDGASCRAEWLFTDRWGGSSTAPFDELNLGASVGDDPVAVIANRRVAAGYVGAERIALVHQVHGREVVELGAIPEAPPEADAIVTAVSGLPVGTQVADCVPILLADLSSGRVAAVHAGWRGVVADVVGAAVDVLGSTGDVRAWIGPAICGGCYEVSTQVRDQVADAAPGSATWTRQGTPSVDLRAGVLGQLARRGIAGEVVAGCTYESRDLYSYRRDGVTGRQMGIVVLHRDGP